jgi:hypothetical protein
MTTQAPPTDISIRIDDDTIAYVAKRMNVPAELAKQVIQARGAHIIETYFKGGDKFLWVDIDRRVLLTLDKNGHKRLARTALKDIERFDKELKKHPSDVYVPVLGNLEQVAQMCFDDTLKYREFEERLYALVGTCTSDQLDLYALLFVTASDLCAQGSWSFNDPTSFEGACIKSALETFEPSPKLVQLAKKRLEFIASTIGRFSEHAKMSVSGFA